MIDVKTKIHSFFIFNSSFGPKEGEVMSPEESLGLIYLYCSSRIIICDISNRNWKEFCSFIRAKLLQTDVNFKLGYVKLSSNLCRKLINSWPSIIWNLKCRMPLPNLTDGLVKIAGSEQQNIGHRSLEI